MHPGGQEGKPLQESFDVGVLALIRLQLEAGRHLGIAFGELRPHASEKGELTLVVIEQIVTHCRPP
jgi:hypothetical protein